jgi:hypothetical protein
MAGPSVRPQRVSDFFWPPFLPPVRAKRHFFPPAARAGPTSHVWHIAQWMAMPMRNGRTRRGRLAHRALALAERLRGLDSRGSIAAQAPPHSPCRAYGLRSVCFRTFS